MGPIPRPLQIETIPTGRTPICAREANTITIGVFGPVRQPGVAKKALLMTKIEYPTISDSDIPAGSGGINREGYTYGQLRRQPIIPEVMRGITDPTVRRWAEECNTRNRGGFVMRRVEGEYSFDGIHPRDRASISYLVFPYS